MNLKRLFSPSFGSAADAAPKESSVPSPVPETDVVDDAFVQLAGGHLDAPFEQKTVAKPGDGVQENDYVVLAGGFSGVPLRMPGETEAASESGPDADLTLTETAAIDSTESKTDLAPVDPDNPVIDVHDPHLESFGPLPDFLVHDQSAEQEKPKGEPEAEDPAAASISTLRSPFPAIRERKARRWPWRRQAQQDVHVSYDHDWGTGVSVGEEEALRQRLMNKNQPPKSRRGSVLILGMMSAAAAVALTAGNPSKVLEAVPDAKRIVSQVQNDLITRVALTTGSTEPSSDGSLCAQQPSVDGCFTNNVIRAAAFVCPTAMHPIAVEFASSPVRAAVGLSHRASMAPSTGFATVLSAETTFDFMTRDLNFAVDLVSFRRNGTIAGMLKNVQPRQQLPVQVAKADGIVALRGNEVERLGLTPDCRIAIFENGIPPEYFSQDAKVNNSPQRINTIKPQTQAKAELGR